MLWASGTTSRGVVLGRLQDDCNFVLVNAAGAAVWATNTASPSCGRAPPPVPPVPPPVDPTTITNKVLMGYQGWFGCIGDPVPGTGQKRGRGRRRRRVTRKKERKERKKEMMMMKKKKKKKKKKTKKKMMMKKKDHSERRPAR